MKPLNKAPKYKQKYPKLRAPKLPETLFWVGGMGDSHDAMGDEIGYWIKASSKLEALKKALYSCGWSVSAPGEMSPEVLERRKRVG